MAEHGSSTIAIGYVQKAHGVRGAIKIALFDRESTSIENVDFLTLAGTSYAIAARRSIDGGFIVELDGVKDRDSADALKGLEVEVDRDEIPEEDGVLLSDLVGCEVIADEDERVLGTVVAVEMGPQDRLIVRDGDNELMIPVVDEFLVEIDLSENRVFVALHPDWPVTKVKE